MVRLHGWHDYNSAQYRMLLSELADWCEVFACPDDIFWEGESQGNMSATMDRLAKLVLLENVEHDGSGTL